MPASTQIPVFKPTPTQANTTVPENDPVLVGAGDIADGDSDGDEATANLPDNIPGTVFTTADIAYNDGTLSEFVECYDPHGDATKTAMCLEIESSGCVKNTLPSTEKQGSDA